MELKELGEFGLIARIKKRLPALASAVLQGSGDDAAVAVLSPGMDLVSTVDLLAEKVHFDLSFTPPCLPGRKSRMPLDPIGNMSFWPIAHGSTAYSLILWK